ncbi:MAG: 50S ribosomal protein L22 [Candidatus Pacebacteria bacterium]|nr:50S ribosomal protein L22 [Candidatus Paceibacterota bacterium]
MQIIAEQKNTRQSSRKVRLVANAVRKLSVKAAFEQLAVMERKASIVVAKVLRQAIANALHNHRLTADQIEIENILVNEGPTYKRFRAVSRGRAHTIFKRTSHVKVVLKTKEANKADKAPVVAEKAAVKTEVTAEPKKTTKKVVKKAKK